MKHTSPSGFTLLEMLIAMSIASILGAIFLPSLLSLLGWMQLQNASMQLKAKLAQSRMMVSSSSPSTACIWEEEGTVKVAAIDGDECELVVNWESLPLGVLIDKENSTLRTVPGIAGDGGVIYRASWANTDGGDYGSYGQLGRLTLVNAFTPRKVCAILYDTDGRWEIRYDSRCIPTK